MQMEVHKTLYPFYTTKKIPHVIATVTKLLFVGRNSQVITIIYAIGYLHIFKAGYFFSKKHCHNR